MRLAGGVARSRAADEGRRARDADRGRGAEPRAGRRGARRRRRHHPGRQPADSTRSAKRCDARRRPRARSSSPAASRSSASPSWPTTGADYVSVGALTHSAPAADLSFELERLIVSRCSVATRLSAIAAALAATAATRGALRRACCTTSTKSARPTISPSRGGRARRARRDAVRRRRADGRPRPPRPHVVFAARAPGCTCLDDHPARVAGAVDHAGRRRGRGRRHPRGDRRCRSRSNGRTTSSRSAARRFARGASSRASSPRPRPAPTACSTSCSAIGINLRRVGVSAGARRIGPARSKASSGAPVDARRGAGAGPGRAASVARPICEHRPPALFARVAGAVAVGARRARRVGREAARTGVTRRDSPRTARCSPAPPTASNGSSRAKYAGLDRNSDQ